MKSIVMKMGGLKDGNKYLLSWVVFPDAQEATVNARYNALRQLVEG